MPSQKLNARRALLFAAGALFAVLALACGGNSSTNNSGGGAVRLQGAGATFPNPLYQKWLSEYKKVNPSASIDYQSVGSGAGVKQFTERTIDFGATDLAMTDDELKKAQGEVVHIPTVLGAVVVTYNLAGVAQPLRFSPDVLADIFLGKIKRWDDARLKADNPGVSLPAADISVAHRSDGSGTSAVFTDYLSKVSPEWKSSVGVSKTPTFPVGQGGKGNEGVTAIIKQQPNTIGYVELIYAKQNHLPVAFIKNSAANFVEPSLDAVTAAAAASIASTPDDLRVSITNAAGASAYPVSSYTYILVSKDQADAAKGKALVDFLWWGLHDGTQFARALDFAPLPDEMRKHAEAKLNSITSGGKTLRQ
ncbi:MAG: phosphate transport system substrate-binding protein [Acidobacteriota bacterium]|jgi:phosphate transport system substrate-binding protein|nr:phosphate transport system substrate-binding protein [Acidobacteriota bacterium]